MKRVTFHHLILWRDPATRVAYHVDEHRVLHVLAEDAPCELMNFLIADDIAVEPGDYWNGDQDNPQFSKDHFLGIGPEWDDGLADKGRAGFNAVVS